MRFESWRDFDLVAAKKLGHDVEAAEDRWDKRRMQSEIDTEAKKMKRKEVERITRLVDQARAADPRLKREKERIRKEKEEKAGKVRACEVAKNVLGSSNSSLCSSQAEREAKEKADRESKEKEEAEKAAAEEEEERKVRAANLKMKKEKEKKALRKAKNLFRKLALKAFEEKPEGNWDDLVQCNEEVEVSLAGTSTK